MKLRCKTSVVVRDPCIVDAGWELMVALYHQLPPLDMLGWIAMTPRSLTEM